MLCSGFIWESSGIIVLNLEGCRCIVVVILFLSCIVSVDWGSHCQQVREETEHGYACGSTADEQVWFSRIYLN